MPRFESTRRRSILGSHATSALLAVVLAGLSGSLFTVSQATGGGEKVAPTAPTSLRVTAVSQTSVSIEWNASTDNVGVVGYRVGFAKPFTAKTTATRLTVNWLTCGASYPVEVRAYDHAGNVSAPATAIVSTAPCVDTQPPSPPSGLQQLASSPTSATIAWSPSTDNVAVAGYGLSRGGLEVDSTTDTSYSFAGLSCGRTYVVAVRAYDVGRNTSPWVSFYVATSRCGDVSAPTAPTGIVQTDRTVSSLSLAWSPSTDNVGVARYDVFRNGAAVGSTSGLSYALSGLACGTSHAVGVEAVDGAGNHSARTSATMSTAACTSPPPPSGDTQPPTAPTSLLLGAATATSLSLTWSPSTDDVAVTGYGVFRNGTRVQVVSGTTYVFEGLTCGTTYQLGVEAYDATGNTSVRATATASTSACSGPRPDSSPPTTPQNLVLLDKTSSSITVSWAASTDNVGVSGYGTYVNGTFAGSTGATSYTFTGLPCATSRVLGVDAYDAAGNRSSKASIAVVTSPCGDSQVPNAPSGLTVSSPTQGGFTLNWLASSDNVGVAGYDVFVNGSKFATVTGVSYTASGLTCGTSYTVGVEAFDAAGNRSSRVSATATTAQCSSPPPPPPPGGSASVFVASNGSDSAPCTQTAPCASFDRAYQVADPGGVVRIAGGSYPAQTILVDGSKTSATDVIFQPAAGASVAINGDLTSGSTNGTNGAKHLTVRDVKVNGALVTRPGSEDLTFERIDANGFNISGGNGITVLAGDYGPVSSGPAHIKQGARNVVIDGAVFHDFTITDPDKHSECLMIWEGASGVTIRNSVFQNCTDFGILVKNASSLVVENSMFDVPMPGDTATVSCNPGCPRGGNSIALSEGSGFVVRYTSLLGGIRVDPEVSGVTLKANVGPRTTCPGNASYGNNVWSAAKCSATDRTASLTDLFLGPTSSSFDLRLKAGAAAIGAGDGADYPSRDMEGESRPQGGAPDSGADERT